MALDLREIVGRKHGPVPFALDVAVLAILLPGPAKCAIFALGRVFSSRVVSRPSCSRRDAYATLPRRRDACTARAASGFLETACQKPSPLGGGMSHRFQCPFCSQRFVQDENLEGPNFCPTCRRLFLWERPLACLPGSSAWWSSCLPTGSSIFDTLRFSGQFSLCFVVQPNHRKCLVFGHLNRVEAFRVVHTGVDQN